MFNHVKLINKAIATEEYLTSVNIITERKKFCFVNRLFLLFLLLLILSRKQKQKKKENDDAGFIKQAFSNIFIKEK